MIFRPRVALTLLAALSALAFPAGASAAFTVNSAGDEPDLVPGGECSTVAGKCTLRAAIEVTNAAATADDILFDATVFEGQLADTIALGSPLPAIKAPVSINAGTCLTAAAVNGPCAGVSGPSGSFGISVEADGVSISDLAVTGALTGINVINGSTGLTARGNWIGVKLDGTAGANNTGIFIDPDSDAATIGGSEVVQRNVIAGNNNEGLDIEGASEAVVQGNYFGVAPDGTTQMANGKDIEITDSTASGGFAAEDNAIGASIEDPSPFETACAMGCNVISGALGTGIDLNGSGLGEEPASGPTTILGNFVGLDATGTDVVANGGIGIWAGGADHVTVGGLNAVEKVANYIAGGSEGIVSESGGQDFRALGNRIGFGSDGSEQTPPGSKGIFVLSLDVTEPASIEENVVRMLGGVGIDQGFEGPRIIGNEVEGGAVGIWTRAGEGGGLIAGNTVDAPSEYGILIENRNTEARQNTITNSDGAGIAVKNPPGVAMTGVLIGGSTAERENVIEGSAGAAIEVIEEALEPGSATEITRNHGALNGGPFIDLVGGANGGIEPPVVGAALQSSAGGTAEPGTTVRVFGKAGPEAGELREFLAETEADGGGNWKVSYPSIAAGTLVTATQTDSGATSQLASAVAAASESSGGGGGGGNGGSGGANNNGGKRDCCVDRRRRDTTPPDTQIVKGPPKKTHRTTAKLKFTATESGSSFQCKMDRKPFKSCRSPKTYKKLRPGKHVFKVRAIDPAGNVDSTPAKRRFTVLG